MTLAIIALNTWVYFYEAKLSSPQLGGLFQRYGLTPAHVTRWHSLAGLKATAASFVTSLFLHGGFWHCFGNMLFLWVFGGSVEDSFGHLRFLVFYLACGVAGGVAHATFNLNSSLPCVGASGAIAGVLGAYLLMFPAARIRTILPIFVIWPLFISIPAVVFIGIWFVMQLMNGLAEVDPQSMAADTAWWAHIGGFIAGILLLIIFRPATKPRSDYAAPKCPVRRG